MQDNRRPQILFTSLKSAISPVNFSQFHRQKVQKISNNLNPFSRWKRSEVESLLPRAPARIEKMDSAFSFDVQFLYRYLEKLSGRCCILSSFPRHRLFPGIDSVVFQDRWPRCLRFHPIFPLEDESAMSPECSARARRRKFYRQEYRWFLPAELV